MFQKYLFAILCLLTVAGFSARAQQAPFYLKNGDVVVFYGDSITEARQYNRMVELYTRTRFPDLDVKFIHSGVGGDRVSGGSAGDIDTRLVRDVFQYDPTVVTIMLGMNDASYRAFDPEIFATFSKGYIHILDEIKKNLPKARVTVIKPSPFDDVTRPEQFPGGYNATLIRYGAFVDSLGRARGLQVVDFQTPMVAMLKGVASEDSSLARQIIPDRIHPSEAGHQIMAGELLKAWNAPALVSATTLDAAGLKVVEARNTSIADLKKEGNTLTWSATDGAVPLYLSPDNGTMQLALKNSDFVERLNQQPLRVVGLEPGKYRLFIDGESIGPFTHTELAAGINLGVYATPLNWRYRLTEWALYPRLEAMTMRLRLQMNEKDDPGYAPAAEALMRYADRVDQNVRNTARATPHTFKVVPE